jgi:hypothetical protein
MEIMLFNNEIKIAAVQGLGGLEKLDSLEVAKYVHIDSMYRFSPHVIHHKYR